MNRTLILAFLRQRLRSPIRIVPALCIFSFPLLLAAVAPGAGFRSETWLFVVILGAGFVGQDVSSGVLTGIFARPVRRVEYAMSRWIGLALCASGLVVLQAAAGFAIQSLRGFHPGLAGTALTALGCVLAVLGDSAVLLLLSCLLNGIGDAAAFLAGMMAGSVIQAVGSFKNWAWLRRLGVELSGFVQPVLDPRQFVEGTVSSFALVSYVSTIVLCLALAVVLINRKELSYAAAG